MNLLHPRNRYFAMLDLMLLATTPVVSLALRLDWSSATGYWPGLWVFTFLSLLIKPAVFFGFGLYRRYWRYASINELWAIAGAVSAASGVMLLVYFGTQAWGVLPGAGLPRSIPFIDALLTLMVVAGPRFSVRAIAERNPREPVTSKRRVLLAGAGAAGALLAREMHNSQWLSLEPVCFVDDDSQKQRAVIYGVPVLGRLKDLPELARRLRIDEVVIAMPSAPGLVIRAVRALCEEAQVEARIMPGIYELLSGQVSVNYLRHVQIEDLLRREPVVIDADEVARMLAGRAVMVTGAGGSIGSELCRQIARSGPGYLILVGHGENSLFTIEAELRHRWPNVPLRVCVADIRDEARLGAIFEGRPPQLVFHAAAHKHVPLMEHNPAEAVANNVGGTQALLNLAERFGVERFVLISSDKAVNPTNVMGATKRVAELLVQSAAARTSRPFVAVRFGNVLGSRGSVVPTFREQIAHGGPVTITHPDMRRYFMTIPEAVQLVLQAATLGAPQSGGEVFVLDMGEPVRIVDLAKDLIQLSGLEVGRDIEITFTGLRPGEKLFEELFGGGETYQSTKHSKILTVTGARPFAAQELEAQVETLLDAARRGDESALRAGLRGLVPAYQPEPLALNPTGSHV